MSLSEVYKNDVKRIAVEAGIKIMTYYRDEALWQNADFVDIKADNSPVTFADKAADDYIVEALTKLTPDIPVLSEEGGQLIKNFERVWVVDPLDGTRQFLKRQGHFTVNIALLEEGRPTLGVIYEPIIGKLYVSGDVETAIEIDKGLEFDLCHGSLTKRLDLLDSFLAFCYENSLQVNAFMISSSLKYCYVTDGHADAALCVHPMSCWDVAAADAIIQSVGGILGIWQPQTKTIQPLDYLHYLETNEQIPSGAVALSPKTYDLLFRRDC